MTLTLAPSKTSSTARTMRRSGHPRSFDVPALHDEPSFAIASLERVAGRVHLLHAALGEDASFYARLVGSGFLDTAIEFTRCAIALVDADPSVDIDGFGAMVEHAVLDSLLAARDAATPPVAQSQLADELRMASAAAASAARGLRTLVIAR